MTSFMYYFSPEYFQQNMHEILSGIKGVVCLIDDMCVLVHGATQEEHNDNFTRSSKPNSSKWSYLK